MFAWLPSRPTAVSVPLPADRVAAEDGKPEVGKEGDRLFKIANGDPDVFQFDGHALHAIDSSAIASQGAALNRGERMRAEPR